MLRATGCQGGRAPLLIQEGDGAFAPGMVTRFRRGWRDAAEALPMEQSCGRKGESAEKRWVAQAKRR
jgi:hypothetical protein